jgi:hypothetical protein
VRDLTLYCFARRAAGPGRGIGFKGAEMLVSIARRIALGVMLLCGTLSAPLVAQSERAPDGAACRQKVERFFAEIEPLLAREPRNIGAYDEVLVRHFSFVRGPSSSEIVPDASTVNCDAQELIAIAKRSRFFFEAAGRPRYAGLHIELRNDVMKVWLDFRDDKIVSVGRWTIHPSL